MHPELLARCRRQTAAGLGVAGLRVVRDTSGRGGPAALPAPRRAPPTRVGRPRTICCPHSVGVMHTRAATMSATRLVPGVPDARKDRLGRTRDRADDRFVLEGGQVRPRSAAAHDGDDVAVAPAQRRDGPGDGRRRTGALHGDPHVRDTEPEPRSRELPEEVPAALGARTGDQADVQRHRRAGAARHCAGAGPRSQASGAAAPVAPPADPAMP